MRTRVATVGAGLVIADAVVVNRASGRPYATGQPEELAARSSTCLRRGWRAEHFSWIMTTTLHRPAGQEPRDRLPHAAYRAYGGK